MIILDSEFWKLSNMKEENFFLDFALMLYQQRRISLGKACRISNLSYPAFQEQLAKNKITIDIAVEDLKDDLESIKHFNDIK